ncbi:hypothetical protein V8D89_003381 [Ganoderma adspersum]
MEEYFDGRIRYKGEDFGGYAKWIAMNSGHIHLFNSVTGPLTFYLPSELNNKSGYPFHDPPMAGTPSNHDASSSTSGATALSDPFHRTPHPINALFVGLLQSLHANYTLVKEQNNPSTRPAATPVPVVEEADEAPTEEEMWFIDAYNVDFKEPVRKKGTVYSDHPNLEELAANVKQHKDVVSLFR